MLVLLGLLAAAAPPTLSCETIEVDVPEDPLDAMRPKGFQWEGFRPIGIVSDGRAVFGRGSALEKLSRRELKRQHEEDAPDRVMQLAVVGPQGKLEAVALVPRGTPVELHRMPDGGLVLARTRQSATVLEHVDAKGRWTGTTSLVEDPQFHKDWRRENPIRGTAPPRLAPTADGKVVVWHAGNANGFNLLGHDRTGATELWTIDLPVVHPKRGEGELVIVDRSARLAWYAPDLQRKKVEDCAGCRVVALEKLPSRERGSEKWKPTPLVRHVAVARPDGLELELRFRGASEETEEIAPVRLAVPAAAEGFDWTWRVRSGPSGSAIVSVSAPEAPVPHQAWAFDAGSPEPTRAWTAPDGLVRGGEHLVVDGFGPLIRLRAVTGEGPEERTARAALLDPTTGQLTDVFGASDVDADLWKATANPWKSWYTSGRDLLRVEGDPEMERFARGPAALRFERCRVDVR